MLTFTQRGRFLTAVLALSLTAVGCDDSIESPTEPGSAYSSDANRWGYAPPDAFDVYTQNAFHGGDTSPIFALDFNDIPAVIAAANLFWGDVSGLELLRARGRDRERDRAEDARSGRASRRSSASPCSTQTFQPVQRASTCWP